MPFLFVKQVLVTDVSGYIRRIYKERHTLPSLRNWAMVRAIPSKCANRT